MTRQPAPCRPHPPAPQLEQLKEKVLGVEAAARSKRSPGKGAVQLGAGATLPEQRRSLFRSDSEDVKLESDIEIGTIPAV